VIDTETGAGIKTFPSYLLVGVIFGSKMTEEHKGQILEWCAVSDQRVDFYQAKISKSAYEVEIVPAD